MALMTISLPDDKHLRLKELTKTRGISLKKLMEEFSNMALAEFDVHTRFKALAVMGDPNKGLMLLDKLDEHFDHS